MGGETVREFVLGLFSGCFSTREEARVSAHSQIELPADPYGRVVLDESWKPYLAAHPDVEPAAFFGRLFDLLHEHEQYLVDEYFEPFPPGFTYVLKYEFMDVRTGGEASMQSDLGTLVPSSDQLFALEVPQDFEKHFLLILREPDGDLESDLLHELVHGYTAFLGFGDANAFDEGVAQKITYLRYPRSDKRDRSNVAALIRLFPELRNLPLPFFLDSALVKDLGLTMGLMHELSLQELERFPGFNAFFIQQWLKNLRDVKTHLPEGRFPTVWDIVDAAGEEFKTYLTGVPGFSWLFSEFVREYARPRVMREVVFDEVSQQFFSVNVSCGMRKIHRNAVVSAPALLPVENFQIFALFKSGLSIGLNFDVAGGRLLLENFLATQVSFGMKVSDIMELKYVDGNGVSRTVPNPLYCG